jgi:ADP-L-glycero-D-manno-heptose 6-epimerase
MSDFHQTILITGAAGFIGGHLAKLFADKQEYKLILADDFSKPRKEPNWSGITGAVLVDRSELIDWLEQERPVIDWVIHLGARTDTTEFDYSIHEQLNLNYSKSIWNYCVQNHVPLVYASSAATYGAGEQGYLDDESSLDTLRPLNPYGLSKHQFDQWVMQQPTHPPHWYGLKFFNVYGHRESHKGRMASMVYHGFNQIHTGGSVRLFRSHRNGIADGEQKRDFIYVKDIIRVIEWLLTATPTSGIYNLGTGEARSFNDLIRAVFKAMNRSPRIEYIDMPEDLRETYQYFTQAPMQKLQNAGYRGSFYSLEEGVADYVCNYLLSEADPA